jgi:sugar phosphate isomerase/epimerase
MSENHSPRPRRSVGYALNVFPAETLADLRACLAGDVARIKQRIFPDTDFPIELRFSERIVAELQQTPGAIASLRKQLADLQLSLVTVNAFVMPHFHGERVKERVYLPAWHESDDRVRFTNASLDILAECGTGKPSVSVPFGALKPVSMAAVAPNILKCAEHAATTGCILALEPEPGLCVETTEEVIEFFQRFVPDRLRPHLGVNFDLAHQLVEFENLPDSIARLQAAGILIAKVHVSNAAEMTELNPFYEDSIYLHQVCGVDSMGRRAFFSLDWPAAVPPGLAKFRIHYHLPVFPSSLPSTLGEVERFLTGTPTLPLSIPFIIETYTWPQQLRGQDRLVDNICEELTWVLERISLSGR